MARHVVTWSGVVRQSPGGGSASAWANRVENADYLAAQEDQALGLARGEQLQEPLALMREVAPLFPAVVVGEDLDFADLV